MAGRDWQAIRPITYVTIYQEGFILRTKKALSFESALVRETGLEPACTIVHMNLNHARLPIPPFPQILVGRGGFEPPKSVTADLQSAPFGHSGTYPGISIVKIHSSVKKMELVKGLEPATC